MDIEAIRKWGEWTIEPAEQENRWLEDRAVNACLEAIKKLEKVEQKPIKKYRYKIDTPWAQKGTCIIGEEGYTNPGNYPDLFEEIPDRWVPGNEEYYFSIVLSGSCCAKIESYKNLTQSTTNDCLKDNNVFRTKEKAEAVLKKILALLEEEKEV